MPDGIQECEVPADFTVEERDAVYRAIFLRRDIRSQFTDREISSELLMRLLTAAHHAPSVGFMQPWNFVVIRSDEIKQRVHQAFQRARNHEAQQFDPQREEQYRELKLEGIRETPVNLCITCDRSRHGPVVLGTTADRSTDLYSTVCAVQNLWLAARAEGIGVGWVSILDPTELKQILKFPDHVVPIAYLCLGHVEEFPETPELETSGWLSRIDLEPLIFHETWQGPSARQVDESTCPAPAPNVDKIPQADTASQAAKPPHANAPHAVASQVKASHVNSPPATKRLTLVRHACTAENEHHQFIGSTDSSLSAFGNRQAAHLADYLAAASHQRIWCSPMQRAKQTLRTIAAAAESRTTWADSIVVPDLREIDFGRWESRTYEEIARQAPHEVEEWEQQGDAFTFPQGDSISHFRQRIDRLMQEIARDDADSLLLVTHGGVIRHLLCRYLQLEPSRHSFDFAIAPASVSTVELRGDHAVITSLNIVPLPGKE